MSTQHFNRLTEAQAELLTLCFEEASEVIKEIAKIMRHGLTSHDPTDPLRTLNIHRLARELGQLSTSAAFLVKAGIIPAGEMEWAAEDRWTSVRQYLHHQPPELFERAQEPTPPAVPVADLAGVDLGRCGKCGAAYGSTCGERECAGTNGSSAFEDRPPPPPVCPLGDPPRPKLTLEIAQEDHPTDVARFVLRGMLNDPEGWEVFVDGGLLHNGWDVVRSNSFRVAAHTLFAEARHLNPTVPQLVL